MRRAFTFPLRRRPAVVPEKDRCNQAPGCTNRAVSVEVPADASVTDYARQVRRCIDHPPPGLAASVARGDRCSHCGRGYWPDSMHFDCPPGSDPEDVAIGCQRATAAVEDEADPS